MTDAAVCINVGFGINNQGVNEKSTARPTSKVYRLIGLPEKLEVCR